MYSRDLDYYRMLKTRDFFEYKDNFISTNNQSVEITSDNGLTPKYSIFIPTFGRSNTLIRAINSALIQTSSDDLEIIVIDNDPQNISDTRNLDIVRSFNDKRVRYICNKTNLGPMGNWNCGYLQAKGEWVCMLHDDDVLSPSWYEIMTYQLTNDDNIDVLCVKYKTLKTKDDIEDFMEFHNPRKPSSYEVKTEQIIKSFCAPILGSLIKKSFFVSLGGFDNLTKFEDYIFMANAVNKGNVRKMNVNLYGYCVGDNNDSNNEGLWDDVIIGEYYFRKSFNTAYSGEHANKYAKKRLVSSILIHNVRWLKYVNFSNIRVNSRIILSECRINYHEYIILSAICLPKLIIKQLFNDLKKVRKKL